MPPPVKRSFEVLEHEAEDYGDEHSEAEEPVPSKRLKEEVYMIDGFDITDDEQQSEYRDEAVQALVDAKGAEKEKKKAAHPSKQEENNDHSTAQIADQVIAALLPRIDTRLNDLANTVALRMLEVLGGRMTKLESRMAMMQEEWREALRGSDDEEDVNEDANEDHEGDFDENRGRYRNPPLDIRPGSWRRRPGRKSSYGQPEASNLDNHAPSNPDPPAELNRKKPRATRRRQGLSPHEHPSDSGPSQRQQNVERRLMQIGVNGETPFVANIAAPEYVPQHKLNRSVSTVVDLWEEFFVGSPDKPAINELDRKYGSGWRSKNPSECVYYGLRRTIIDELVSRVELRGLDLEASTEQAAAVWQSVAEEMDADRLELKASLNQYIHELKRRERVRSPPPPPPRIYDPFNDPAPPPQPVLSRTTSTVKDLWHEWFTGKEDYMGHEKFPPITMLNQKWGDAWRRWKTPEYGFYLKRRCIIDIALRRILKKGGDKGQATRMVLQEMDEERESEGLSLLQYNVWIRVKHNYHAASRNHVPMEFVEQDRVTGASAADTVARG